MKYHHLDCFDCPIPAQGETVMSTKCFLKSNLADLENPFLCTREVANRFCFFPFGGFLKWVAPRALIFLSWNIPNKNGGELVLLPYSHVAPSAEPQDLL